MGLLQRFLSGSSRQRASLSPAGLAILGGRETLEVVGESFRQEALWRLAGGHTVERVRCPAVAVLEPEPTNPHDRNAVRVLIEGHHVGYLSREDAALYLPGVQQLRAAHGKAIGLYGQIVGGGQREGRLGMLGVFLDHEPADFGLNRRQFAHMGQLRTGLGDAIASDLEDDSYDLSWLESLSGEYTGADIKTLRKLLVDERDPIDRHFMLAELGKCLYKSRDAFASALEEFDAVCLQHHEEMGVIRSALLEKFGVVPVIEMYRQAAIRCQKDRDWNGMRFWAEHGLAVYGEQAARPEAVEDLGKRRAQAEAKLSAPAKPKRTVSAPPAEASAAVIETLMCSDCGQGFDRVRSRGRKPLRCPDCRAGVASDID